MNAQQRWVLEQLDIDIWVGVDHPAAGTIEDVDPATREKVAGWTVPTAASPQGRDAAPAAAALAMLRDAGPGNAITPTNSPQGACAESDTKPTSEQIPSRTSDDQTSDQPGAAAVAQSGTLRLDLWCLSTPRVLLVTDRIGLDTATQRFLRDLVRAVSGHYKALPQQSNFRWPQPDLGDLPVAGALRGFTQRLLSDDSREPVLLLIGANAHSLELPIPGAKRWELPDGAQLAASGASKRGLWQRIQQS